MSVRRIGRVFAAFACLMVGVVVAPAAASAPHANARTLLAIKTLSVRADLVSGHDVLTRILLPAGASASNLHVQLNGRDATRPPCRRTRAPHAARDQPARGRRRRSAC